MYRGETMAGIVTDESRNDPGRGFVSGYHMQLLSLGRAYPNLIYFNKVDRGNHFAAWQELALFSAEVRAAFRSLR